MNYPVLLFKKNMFTEILFSVVALFELNFITIRQGAEGFKQFHVYKAYSNMIEEYPEILEGTTDFCESGDVYLWVGICRQVIKKLQEFHSYQFLYLDYQYFNTLDAQTVSEKCHTKKIKITEFAAEKFKNLKPPMEHSMANCPGRDVIVPKHKHYRTTDYTRTIAITPHPKQIKSVLVFINDKNNEYTLSHLFHELKYVALPHPNIYDLPAPTYTFRSKNLKNMYRKLQAVLTDRPNDTQSNIVDQSDRFYFARMCSMTVKLFGNEPSILDMGKLCDEKPTPFTWKLPILEGDIIVNNLELLVYPCSPPELFVPPDFITSEVVETRTQELLKLHALSRGPDDNSLIFIRYSYNEEGNSIFLVMYRFIENVYDIFLQEIHIPEPFKERCEWPRHNLLF